MARSSVRIAGLLPRAATSRAGVAYFAGEMTMPGFVPASRWGRLGNGDEVTADHRRLRALSRGTRQLIGLRTVLGRQPLGLVVLDEPWEGLDPDGARWLTAAIELKRDRGAAVVLASHRFQDLAGLCDAYLFLLPQRSTWVQAHEITATAVVTPERLMALHRRLDELLPTAQRGIVLRAGPESMDPRRFNRHEHEPSERRGTAPHPGRVRPDDVDASPARFNGWGFVRRRHADRPGLDGRGDDR